MLSVLFGITLSMQVMVAPLADQVARQYLTVAQVQPAPPMALQSLYKAV